MLAVPFFVFLGFVQWLVAVLARTKSWWAGGVIGAIVGFIIFLFAGLLVGTAAIFILGIVGLLLDKQVSKTYRKSVGDKSAPPWWAGGTWGPGGGFFGDAGAGGNSEGGFGGFGGGESGGGGASGDW